MITAKRPVLFVVPGNTMKNIFGRFKAKELSKCLV
jgi:hypothetical protein